MPGLLDSLFEGVQSLAQMDREKKQQQEMSKYRQQEVKLRQQEIEAQKENAAAVNAHRGYLEQVRTEELARQTKKDANIEADKEKDRLLKAEQAAAVRAAVKAGQQGVANRAAVREKRIKEDAAANLKQRQDEWDTKKKKIEADAELAGVKKQLLTDDTRRKSEREGYDKFMEDQHKKQAEVRTQAMRTDLVMKGVKIDTARFDLAFKEKFAAEKVRAEIEHIRAQIQAQRDKKDPEWGPNAAKATAFVEKLQAQANSNYERVFGERRLELDHLRTAQGIIAALQQGEKDKKLDTAAEAQLAQARSDVASTLPRIQQFNAEVIGYDKQRKMYQAEVDKKYGLTHETLGDNGKPAPRKEVPPAKVGGPGGVKVIPTLRKATAADLDRLVAQSGGDRAKLKVLMAKEGLK